jgi:hypothetical protein
MAWPVRGFDRRFAEFGRECHHENPPGYTHPPGKILILSGTEQIAG